MTTLRIGTRKSPLALWQAEHVAALLKKADPALEVELVKMSTRGDRILDAPLAAVGGKGLFVKEIEEALLRGDIDLAVHSLKDMPAVLPPGLILGAHPPRADPRDAWVSPHAAGPATLPQRARVGTSSLRRQCQLLASRPDLEIVPIRGSVETRLNKIASDGLHAVVLAAAGLERLGLGHHIAQRLAPETMLPAVGQGILAVEIRESDPAVAARVAVLEDVDARLAALAERAMLAGLGGSCQVPIAGHAVRMPDGRWWLRGLVASPDGKRVVRADAQVAGGATDGQMTALGSSVASTLLQGGAGAILGELGISSGGG